MTVPSLDVITVPVGANPEIALTTSDYRMAVVFNEGSDDISILDAETLEERRVEVRANLVSFYDSDSGALETITGFELNGEIEHWLP